MSQLRTGTLGFRWSVNGVACSAFGTCTIQAASAEVKGEEYKVKNAAGETIIWYGYDPETVLNASYIVLGASANISASVTKPGFGDLITVTDTLSAITGTFVVQSSKVSLT